MPYKNREHYESYYKTFGVINNRKSRLSGYEPGFTLEDENFLKEVQGPECAICGKEKILGTSRGK